jgi:hypothetical protein
MKTKLLIVLVLGTLLLSIGTGLSTVSAATWPNLPTSTVQLTVIDGTNSYFIATLSSVPTGYSVHNGIYPAWCIDNTEYMARESQPWCDPLFQHTDSVSTIKHTMGRNQLHPKP